MYRLVIAMILVVGAAFVGATAATNTPVWQITRIVDADTVKVRNIDGVKLTVRVLGLDCPESRVNSTCRRDERYGRPGCDQQVPLGRKASRRARQLLESRHVDLECGVTCKSDQWGRALRYIRVGGRDYGLMMIREGHCQDYGWQYPHPRMREYRRAR
jgi:endonuclease YncB( thermonuclease family)